MMLQAVILDYKSLAPEDLAMESLWGLPMEWETHDYTHADKTAERIKDKQIILTNKVILDKALLRSNPQIKLIIILATGTNNVDLEEASALGIPVSNIVSYSTESVVQHTFASLLALTSRLLDYDKAVRAGAWSESQFFGLLDFQIQEVSGKTLGIIGYGAIGKRIKIVAEALGMKTLIAESVTGCDAGSSERTPLPDLLKASDVVSIHCPLSSYSKNLIGEEQLALMKPSALLLNLGRGGIVNEQALANALRAGVIAGAATDVLTAEPPPKEHCLLASDIPNLIVTPHTAWASQQARQELLDQVVNILQSFENGQLINQVNAL